jgi:hypothetical protein
MKKSVANLMIVCITLLVGCSTAGGDDEDSWGVSDFTFSNASPRVGQVVTLNATYVGDLATNGIHYIISRIRDNGEAVMYYQTSVFSTTTVLFRFPLHGTYKVVFSPVNMNGGIETEKSIVIAKPSDAAYEELSELPGVWQISLGDSSPSYTINGSYTISGLRETAEGNGDWFLDVYTFDNSLPDNLLFIGDTTATIGKVWYNSGKCYLTLKRDDSTYYSLEFTTVSDAVNGRIIDKDTAVVTIKNFSNNLTNTSFGASGVGAFGQGTRNTNFFKRSLK